MLRGHWERGHPLPSPGWKETKKTTVNTALPSLVSAMCPVLLQLVAPTSVESVTPEWNWGQKRAGLRRRAAARRGCGAELAGRDGWWHGSAVRPASATPPHSLPTDGLPGEPPHSKTNSFFLKVLETFPFSSPVPPESFVFGTAPLVREAS